jgi:hypothetical protein
MEHKDKDSHRIVFWNRMKSEKLGLITKDECEDTDVVNITKEIADQVKKKKGFLHIYWNISLTCIY